MVAPMADALSRLLERGAIKSMIDVDAETLARILIKGSEVLIHSQNSDIEKRYESNELRQILENFWKRIIDF